MSRRRPRRAAREILRRAASKDTWTRDYGAAVLSGYGQIAVGLVIQAVMVPLYLRHLGQYRFGVLMMLLAGTNFAALGVTWLSGGSLRLLGEAFANGDESRFADVFAVTRWILVGYAIVLAGFVGLPAVAAVDGIEAVPAEAVASVRGGIVGAGAYLVVLYAFNADRVALVARGKQAWADGLTILSQMVYVLTAASILAAGGDLLHLMGAFVVGTLIALVGSRLVWRRFDVEVTTFVRPSARHRHIAKSLTGRMGSAYLAYGVLALALQADVLIVGWLAGPVVAATFVLVWRIPEMAVSALWRLSEAMQPFIIHQDIEQQHDAMRRGYRRVLGATAGLAAVVGLVYAAAGPAIVRLWVGSEHAPEGRLGYVLAGAAVMWLTVARVPVVFAYATVRLRRLTAAMGVELALKVGAMVLLFPRVGYLAPLIAINALHALGFTWLYQALGWRVVRVTPAVAGGNGTRG